MLVDVKVACSCDAGFEDFLVAPGNKEHTTDTPGSYGSLWGWDYRSSHIRELLV